MTLSSGASPTEPTVPPTEDQRIAAAAQARRFGYILLAIGAVMGIAGVVTCLITEDPLFLILLITAVFDVVLALRQFSIARKV